MLKLDSYFQLSLEKADGRGLEEDPSTLKVTDSQMFSFCWHIRRLQKQMHVFVLGSFGLNAVGS